MIYGGATRNLIIKRAFFTCCRNESSSGAMLVNSKLLSSQSKRFKSEAANSDNSDGEGEHSEKSGFFTPNMLGSLATALTFGVLVGNYFYYTKYKPIKPASETVKITPIN